MQNACYEKCPEFNSNNGDYIHINSVAVDPKDNNLLVSSAYGYYVMKLDRKTGDILWILGGKANQFKVPKDAEFIRQHNAHFLDKDQLVLFDNHYSSLSPEEIAYHHSSFENTQAQILLLNLDEKNKVVKSFQKIPLNFTAPHMGSVQKIRENAWLIGCGTSSECTAQVIDDSGNPLWTMKASPPPL